MRTLTIRLYLTVLVCLLRGSNRDREFHDFSCCFLQAARSIRIRNLLLLERDCVGDTQYIQCAECPRRNCRAPGTRQPGHPAHVQGEKPWRPPPRPPASPTSRATSRSSTGAARRPIGAAVLDDSCTPTRCTGRPTLTSWCAGTTPAASAPEPSPT